MFEVDRKRENSADLVWHLNTQCPDWPEPSYFLTADERNGICPRRLEAKMFLPPAR